jgi:hypothetical protein
MTDANLESQADAINNLQSRMNMGKTVSGSMPGCKVAVCLDGLIGESNLSAAEFNNDNSVSNATGASGSTMSRGVNYQNFPRVMGWDGTRGIALPGTEESGCKNAMDLNSSKELCNNSPECDGFFSYARNDSDRVCFKTNVDTSNNVKTPSQDWINNNNAQESGFFVKDDRVKVTTNFQSGDPEPFSNIEEVYENKVITIDNNVFGNIMTTLLFIILTYYLCKKLKLF